MRFLLLLMSALFIAACSSQSVMPEKDEITVSRKKPGKDCKDLGKVTGTSSSSYGTRAQVLEDMKQDAANKGATYVMVKQYSDAGTSVTGVAYQCP